MEQTIWPFDNTGGYETNYWWPQPSWQLLQIQCPHCGVLIDQLDRYCRYCGKQAWEEQKSCPICGRPYPDE